MLNVNAEYDFAASFRGRWLGYSLDRFLIYGTAGDSYADIKATATITDRGNTASSTFEQGFNG